MTDNRYIIILYATGHYFFFLLFFETAFNIDKQPLLITEWVPIIMENNWSPNQHIVMISKGSYDTDVWNNDC